MGNQAGRQKGEPGDGDIAPSGDAGVPPKHKKGLFGIGRTGSGQLAGAASQPIECAREGAGVSGDSLPTKSPSSGAMPVPSPKNLPIGVPMSTGTGMPYKRPKGTIDWDSEDDEDMEEVAARKKNGSQSKVSFSDFEPLKVIGNGCFGKVMMVKFRKNDKIYAMKSIRKAHVVKNNKVRHTLAERNIMQKITHPFVMKLHYAFQNDGKLYMVMDYLNGGDIFYHLSISRRFSE